jgi:hypothetical protein
VRAGLTHFRLPISLGKFSACQRQLMGQYMNQYVTSEELKAISTALQANLRDQMLSVNLVSKIAHSGWASFGDIEDLLYLMDGRVDDIKSHITVKRWCEIFSIPFRFVHERPTAKQATTFGVQAIVSSDAAGLLVKLERLGFRLDPSLLIRELLPTIKLSEFLTDSQLSIFWYARARDKNQPTILSVTAPSEFTQTHRFVTPTGYKVECALAKDSTPLWLTSQPPKYRRRPAQKPETCKACGYQWTRGDTDSRAAHRTEHRRRLEYLEPKPIAEMTNEFGNIQRLIVVTTTSSTKMHQQMYLRAVAFKREFGYDFIQWGKPKSTDPDARGFLFLNSEAIIVGACAFRHREHQDARWQALQWIWIAPKYRRSGILSSYWHELRSIIGDFHVEPPVSAEMQAFLYKMGDERLLAWEQVVQSGGAR